MFQKLSRIWSDILWNNDNATIGDYRANDGVLYTAEQYADMLRFLRENGYNMESVSILHVVGSITVWNPIHEFYMRDLINGVIRDDADSRAEYHEAVVRARMV